MSVTKQDFIWYELMSKDLDAAAKFYAAVVGWTIAEIGSPEMRYLGFGIGGDKRSVGGMMQLSPEMLRTGAPQQWIGYLHADDVDAATEKAKEAGAQVWRQPHDLPGVGRFALLSDPQGAPFYLMAPQPQGELPPKLAPDAIGNVGWTELIAPDWTKEWPFYESQFGWTLSESFDMGGPMGVYQCFSSNEQPMTGGMMSTPEFLREATGNRAHWGFYFNVDNIQSAKDRVEKGGGTVTHGPQQVPGGGWTLNGVDPLGASFALFSRES